ncbi:hypothetical protein [Polyangium mundeleinium]|uniref:Uncharacterized protein n=1 Tax=Polyangium mundeleinium TaxID=2995306 RepID=A0ABT5F4S9_9BACT|nr:hypothetical protein [Polyangium mundeleinium]MDC0749083.1 hypothetical protein [Polyangium mundeleinium]
MGACTKVLGAVVAIGIALGTPALAWAQAPLAPLSAGSQPWQPAQVVTPATPFGDGYRRVLLDTFEAFEAFADLTRYGAPPAITPAVQVSVPSQLWGADMRTFIPQSPEQPTIYVGPMRALLIPIETATTVVAESRGMQGVLMGFQLELPWMIP